MLAAVVSCAVVVSLSGCFGGGDDKIAASEADESAVSTCLLVDDSMGPEVDDLPVVDCGEEHSHEIFAVIPSSSEVYPGFEALEQEAQVVCLAAFEPYVGISAFDSNLFYSWMVPTLAGWEDKRFNDGKGDRNIICVVGPGDASLITGSLRDSRR